MDGASIQAPSRGMAAALSQLHSAIDAVAHAAQQESDGSTSHLRSVERAGRRIESVKLALIARADRSRAADSTAHVSTASMVGQVTRSGGAAAAAQVSLAVALEESCPRTRVALAAGDLTPQAAVIIAGAMDKLPADLDDDARSDVEHALVRDAKVLDPGRLRRAATRALEVAKRTAAEVDAHQDEVLRTQEERAYAASRITLHDNGDGTTTGRFTVPTLAASMLRKAIQSMTSPRRDHLRTPADPGGSPPSGTGGRGGRVVGNGGRGVLSSGPAANECGARDQGSSQCGMSRPSGAPRDADWADLSWQEKAGRAFVDLIEHLPTDRLSSKNAATVVVTMQVESLRGGLRAAGVETGHDISAAEARRLACSAGLVPVVLDGDSLPLDLGRQQRHFSPHQRVALAGIYDSCAAEDCDRPYAWCELHHEDPWHPAGQTNLDRAIPVCGFHHRLIDNPRYRTITTRDGPRATVRFVLRT